MNNQQKPKAVGINHIAIEVGNIDDALRFYGEFLDFTIESQDSMSAFIYFGDQFINFAVTNNKTPDDERHFGIVVDNKPLVRHILEGMGVNIFPGHFLDFHDPWGNRVEITTYENIRYTKTDHILEGMGLSHLGKSDAAKKELKDNGFVVPETE